MSHSEPSPARNSRIDSPARRLGPLLSSPSFRDTKDPCPVHDGARWHLFGSGGSSTTEVWHILHAVGPALEGPWTELPPSSLHGVQGDHVAAPGVVWDAGRFHMFIQTDHAALDGTIEHLVSDDGGATFVHQDRCLSSIPGTDEAGIYDPHPAVISGEKYLVYSGLPKVTRPDLHLARSASGSWDGPWTRVGRILEHADVEHHNQPDHPDYEWGLEGAQLVELPAGLVLLNAVCFLPDQPRGRRQRVFFAVAERPEGPYTSLGPVLHPDGADDWESGENGHAAAVVEDDALTLFYQGRPTGEAGAWRYGVAVWSLQAIERAAERLFRRPLAAPTPAGQSTLA